jgi:hypothetical protein
MMTHAIDALLITRMLESQGTVTAAVLNTAIFSSITVSLSSLFGFSISL